MKHDLLKLLSAHLRTIAPKSFALENWSCGTTACAIGHAVNVPEIAAAGLTLRDNGEGVWVPYVEDHLAGGLGWPAVRCVFDLDNVEARHLFSLEAYQSDSYSPNTRPATVADRIDKFIQEAS